MNKERSAVSNNLINFDTFSTKNLQESSQSTHCHGPLCRSFICYIDTLPIGHSVVIQLKAYLRLNQLQSVSFYLTEPFD